MTTAISKTSLAHQLNMPDPSWPHGDQYGRGGQNGFPAALVLNTPSHQSSGVPRVNAQYEAYLPTPESGGMQGQQQQHPFLQKHTADYRAEAPDPVGNQWQPSSIAGPSTYRRSPNVTTPMSVSSPQPSRGVPIGHVSPVHGRGIAERTTVAGEQTMMDGMQRMAVDEGDGRIGVEEPFGERSYTEMKCLGDGSFGTVWLCDWHSPVRPDTTLSAMQCGAGARPEWAGKRLVALKRMKRVWEGGWSQARTLGEIYSLSRIPSHPAIIPLYDAFISPKSRELYFVFECMEGNLYQLTKSRRGRPLAAGLVASCFHQISTGLHHIHEHGYFHRDMKPENLLVTTTGLVEYLTPAGLHRVTAQRRGEMMIGPMRGPDGQELEMYEKDVMVIVKLADFGLARATNSKPPYTEYVSTRWYRAPEVLLRSTEYGPPVDMWALGTILAEMINLKPLFPGVSEIDQVYRICDTMGDPADRGVDKRGRAIGGGVWVSGIRLAKKVGFSFPKRDPVDFSKLFNDSVPQSMVDCISELLRYNPRHRMTSAQCLDHPYFHETLPHLKQTPPLPRIPFAQGQPQPRELHHAPAELVAPPRAVPPSHSHQESRPAFANGDMRTLPPPIGTPDVIQTDRVVFPSGAKDRYEPSALVSQLRELDLPTEDLHSYGQRRARSPPRAPLQQSNEHPSMSSVNLRTRNWAEDIGRSGSVAPSAFDGSNYEGSEAASNNASFSQLHMSTHGSQQASRSQSRVAKYVSAQSQIDAYEDGTPCLKESEHQPQRTVQHPSPNPSTYSTPSVSGKASSISTGKKKKWGLSSVFGGGDKSSSNLASVAEVSSPYTGSMSNLKRTQSGGNPAERGLTMSTPMAAPPAPSLDPKQAKKEAEKAKREAELIKRETAARMQKERARAVMMKRQNMMGTQSTKELEWSSSGFTVQPEAPKRSTGGIYPSSSQVNLGSSRDLRQVTGLPGTQSATSIQSEGRKSEHSIYSAHSQSQPALPTQFPMMGDDVSGRRKARRRDEDDDHSMSSFDHNSLRSRSVLTVGTIDSDPGPRSGRHGYPDPKVAHAYSKDPLFNRKAAGSLSSFHLAGMSSSKLASHSNPSFETQFANDFASRAKVASGSSPALGSMSNNSGVFAAQVVGQTQGSAPTSPYGQPTGAAVAHGVGIGRHGGGGSANGGVTLPSIRSWEDGNSRHDGNINPMFKVPPAEGGAPHPDAPPGAYLPPFSDIARVADSHSKQR